MALKMLLLADFFVFFKKIQGLETFMFLFQNA